MKPGEPFVFVVVRKYSWDKDDYICAYLDRSHAEAHRDHLNGEPYEDDGLQDHAVWTMPLREWPHSAEIVIK